MENFNFKKYLAEGKMLKENITPDVEEYLTDLYDLFSSEDYEEGEEISNLISKEEYGDSEAYDNADMFDKAYNEIKQQGGSITIEGEPNITFSLEGEDIKMNYIVEYQNENKVVKEGLLDSFSDYDTVYEIARHKVIPLAMVGMVLVKYGVKKAIELVKGGKEEVMNAIEDSPKPDLDTTPTKQGIKLFKKKDNSAFKKFLDNVK